MMRGARPAGHLLAAVFLGFLSSLTWVACRAEIPNGIFACTTQADCPDGTYCDAASQTCYRGKPPAVDMPGVLTGDAGASGSGAGAAANGGSGGSPVVLGTAGVAGSAGGAAGSGNMTSCQSGQRDCLGECIDTAACCGNTECAQGK